MELPEAEASETDAPLIDHEASEAHEPTEALAETPAPETAAAIAHTGGFVTVPLRTTYLTAAWSEAFGPAGHFVDLTAEEAAGAPEGVLVTPTDEQLALRRR